MTEEPRIQYEEDLSSINGAGNWAATHTHRKPAATLLHTQIHTKWIKEGVSSLTWVLAAKIFKSDFKSNNKTKWD